MSKKRSVRARSARKSRRFSIPVVVSMVVIVAAAITVVSRQVVSGQDVPVNKTGQVKPLSPQEAQQLAAGLKGMLNRSSQGLVEVRQADGSTSMDLQGRFQSVAVARIADDGSITESCVDNPESAAAFFGIDPKLLGVTNPSNQATRSVTVKSPRQ